MTAISTQAAFQSGLLPQVCDVDVRDNSRPEFLNQLARQGKAIWDNASWPTRKTESWKYSSLNELQRGEFLARSLAYGSNKSSFPAGLNTQISNLDSFRLVFVNGEYCAELSNVSEIPNGVTFVDFAAANGEQIAQIRELLNTGLDMQKHIFTALNAQLLSSGVFVHIAKGVEVVKPFEIVYMDSDSETPQATGARCLVNLEDNSSAQLIERFQSAGDSSRNFLTSVTELFLKRDARLKYYKLHLESENASHVSNVQTALESNARLEAFFMAKGSKLKRVDLDVNFNGEAAHCSANGVYLPKGNQHVDFHTCMEHRVAHCTSSEIFRGIVSDSAKAVFNGRIHIHPNAQKTIANLSNKNLLTSDKAEVDTKPELEIYADDVQCSHGATVAQLDDTALHYFKTRGIPAAEAQVMLSFGFINELINQLELEPLVDFLRAIIAEHFSKEESLTRHIS